MIILFKNRIAIKKKETNETLFIETGYIDCPFHNCRTEWLVLLIIFCSLLLYFFFIFSAEIVERNRSLEFERCKERLSFLKVIFLFNFFDIF
jgi:hypothetical protein